MFEGIARLISRFATRRPWIAIVAVLLIVGVAASQGMPSQGNDSTAFAPDDPAIAAAERIDEEFGSEASVSAMQFVVSAADGDVVTLNGLEAIGGIRDAIEVAELDGTRLADLLVAQPGVGAIVSYMTPVEQALMFGMEPPTDDSSVKTLMAAGLDAAPLEQSGFLAGLFSEDADPALTSAEAGLAVAFFQAPSTPDQRAAFNALQGQVLDTLEAASFGDVSATPFSPELIEVAGDGAAIQIPLLLLAAVGIISLLLLVVYLPRKVLPLRWRTRRTVADTALTILVVMLAVSFANGAAYLLGPNGVGLMGDLAGPSSIVPILLVGLGVDYAIHLNAAYRSGLASGATVQNAMARSVRVVGGALVLSSITTIIGFLTNLASGIPALFDFGIYASIGIAAALLFATLVFPAARLLLDRRAERLGRIATAAFEPRKAGALDRTVGAAATIARRRPGLTIGLAGLVLVGAALTATNLRSGFSFVDFVPEGSSIREAAAQLTNDFAGGLGETTQVLVEADLSDPAQWNAALDAVRSAAAIDGVVLAGDAPRLVSPQTVIGGLIDPSSPTHAPDVAEAAAVGGLDGSLRAGPGADLGAVFEAAMRAAPDELAGVVTEEAALFTFTTQAGTDGALALAGDLEEVFGPAATATSLEIIDATVVEAINDIQVQSLILAITAAGLLLALSFWYSDRKPLLGLITVMPVGAIIVLLFAFMVVAGIEFGPVTATLAAVVIGVGVDYTIHVTHRFQDFRREGLPIDDAITRTLSTTGSALVASALTTGIGFAVLMLSTLIPFQQFGVLTLVAIVGSGLASVLVLPSMLVVWARRAEQRTTARSPLATRRAATSET